MNKSTLVLMLLGAIGLAACDRPAVVTVPATPVAVPGPAGPPGAAGQPGSEGGTGATGATGATGKSGDGTAVIFVPAASAPATP
jgi:hypothetical protein